MISFEDTAREKYRAEGYYQAIEDIWSAFQHKSDCAVYNEPAYPKGSCDCGLLLDTAERHKIVMFYYDAGTIDCAEGAVEGVMLEQYIRILETIKWINHTVPDY